ncbi:hypothetical protein HOK51_02055 [Candidatus Woesearchaeota archaeon]|nr:hypothetical protein [Candidatus Woesearchaeota archaeon]
MGIIRKTLFYVSIISMASGFGYCVGKGVGDKQCREEIHEGYFTHPDSGQKYELNVEEGTLEKLSGEYEKPKDYIGEKGLKEIFESR